MDFEKMKKIWDKQQPSDKAVELKQQKIEELLTRRSHGFERRLRHDVFISSLILSIAAIVMAGLIIYFHRSPLIIALAGIILVILGYGAWGIFHQIKLYRATDVNTLSVRESIERKIELMWKFSRQGKFESAIISPIAFISLFIMYKYAKYGRIDLADFEIVIFALLLIGVTVFGYMTGGMKYRNYAEDLERILESISRKSEPKPKSGKNSMIILLVIFLIAIIMYAVSISQ